MFERDALQNVGHVFAAVRAVLESLVDFLPLDHFECVRRALEEGADGVGIDGVYAAAGGHFTFDTTSLTNGVHTIGWLITDDCNRADGVGSRFFTVSNGSLTAEIGRAHV
mgnify:CR=1 FL=1